jgi:hypothetical protein
MISIYEIEEYNRAFVCENKDRYDAYCILAKEGSVLIIKSIINTVIRYGESFQSVIWGEMFNYNVDIRLKGRAAIDFVEVAGGDHHVYFSLANHDDVSGQTGPVLIGKIINPYSDDPVFEAYEYSVTPGLHVGLY